MNRIEIKAGDEKQMKFQYSFSYIIIKRITFSARNPEYVSISSLIESNPSLEIKSYLNNRSIHSEEINLSIYFTPYSYNSILNFEKEELIIIPEYNFKSRLDTKVFVTRTEIKFRCEQPEVKAIISFEQTPGANEFEG